MSEFSLVARTAFPQYGAVSAEARAMMLFESNRRSNLVAYLLWFFLGLFGALVGLQVLIDEIHIMRFLVCSFTAK